LLVTWLDGSDVVLEDRPGQALALKVEALAALALIDLQIVALTTSL